MTKAPVHHLIPEGARCIAYTRVSTEDQARDDAVSLSDQQQGCEQLAAERGFTLDATVEDRASGRNINRRGFQTLLRHCESHPRPDDDRGLVVCLDSSRWGRFVNRPSLANTFADQLYLAGWDLHFVREPNTGNADADVFLGSARSVASAAESKRIAYRASTGMRAQAAQGNWQGRPPFGYDRLAVNSSTGKERRLAPYDHAAKGERCGLTPNDDAPTLTTIFKWAARGDLYEDIAARLNAKRTHGPFDIYPNRGGVAYWTGSTVRALLENPIYIGRHRFNRRTPFDANGKRTVRPAEEHIVIEDAHEPLIDRGTWEKVQARFGSLGPRPRSSRYLLTGTMTCAACGSMLVGGGGTRPKAADPERTMQYKCSACRQPMLTVNKRWLEGKIVTVVGDFVTELIDSGEFDKLLAEVLGARRGDRRQDRAKLERRRGALEQKRTRLVDAIANGTLTDAEAGEKLDAIRSELDDVTANLQRGCFEERTDSLSHRDIAELKARARDFPARIAEAQPTTARQLLAHWLDGIVVDGERRRVTLTLRRLPLTSQMRQAGRS